MTTMPPAGVPPYGPEGERARASAWMPLYIGDYLGDTMHLGGPEHGAYLLLLMHEWRTGPLPDDDRQLANIARTDPAAWSVMAPTIRAFFVAAEGRLIQARLERERVRARGVAEQRREAGKRSAEARAAKQRGGNDRSTSVAAPLEQNVRQSQPQSQDIQKTSSSGAGAPPHPLPDAREVLWADGLAILRRLTGMPDGKARKLLGRWCREARDDCAMVLAALRRAERDRIGDPVPWIENAIATRTGRRAGTGPPSPTAWMMQPNPPSRPAFDFDGVAEDMSP